MVTDAARLIDAAPDPMFLVDGASGVIEMANQQATQVFGYPKERLVGMLVEELMPPRFRGRHVEHRQLFVSNPKLRPMGTNLEIYGLRKNGEEVAVDASLAPVGTDEGMKVLVALRDISARKAQQQTIDATLYQVTSLRHEAQSLKDSVAQYADITRKGLIKASYRGAVMVVAGVILAVMILGLAQQSWSCAPKSLTERTGIRYWTCSVVFPTTPNQVTDLLEAREAREAADQQRNDIRAERARNADVLERVETLLRERN